MKGPFIESVEVHVDDEVVAQAMILVDQIILPIVLDIYAAIVELDLEVVSAVVPQPQLYLSHVRRGQVTTSQDLLHRFNSTLIVCRKFVLDEGQGATILLF